MPTRFKINKISILLPRSCIVRPQSYWNIIDSLGVGWQGPGPGGLLECSNCLDLISDPTALSMSAWMVVLYSILFTGLWKRNKKSLLKGNFLSRLCFHYKLFAASRAFRAWLWTNCKVSVPMSSWDGMFSVLIRKTCSDNENKN